MIFGLGDLGFPYGVLRSPERVRYNGGGVDGGGVDGGCVDVYLFSGSASGSFFVGFYVKLLVEWGLPREL